MEMEEDEYGMMDQIMTHYMNGPPIFPAIPQPPPQDLHYAAMVMSGGGDGGGGVSGLSGDSGSGGACVNMEVAGRWPKEETLALLEIRSRLDSQFKEANHKGPLWEEVSRLMYAEHGYRRTGKKCNVKFENLYKYYKKIKEGKAGKAGRQEKKHYRFFRQLDAIYGETSNTSTNFDANKLASITNSSLPPFMEENDQTIAKRSMVGKKRWKTKITDFIEAKMNSLMEKQEKWMEKMMNTIEEKEKERISKEEQRRKEEAARLEMERKFRLNELAWMQSRDSTMMEALHKLTKNESTLNATSCSEYSNDHNNQVPNDWGENEITQLIQLRSGMETRFDIHEDEFMENALWEEIALIMAGLGYNRGALIYKAKWDHINFQLRNKKQKGCSDLYPYEGERFVALNGQQNECGDRVLMMSDPHEMMWRNYNGNI